MCKFLFLQLFTLLSFFQEIHKNNSSTSHIKDVLRRLLEFHLFIDNCAMMDGV